MPLYLKTNSYGEFIFDWGWANAAHRSGVRYYPKLVAAIPFTPATGQRLPVEPDLPDAEAAAVTAALLRAIRELADDERASSVHFLFCTEAEKAALAAAEYLPRLSMQFHWHNRAERPFDSFDDFLTTFRSRNRKQVRKERQTAAAHGLTFRTATGAELDDARLGGAARVLRRQHRAPRRHPLPQRTLLPMRRARRWRTGWSRRSPTAAPNRSPAPSTSRRARTSTAATGAAWTTSRCCTSSSATTG